MPHCKGSSQYLISPTRLNRNINKINYLENYSVGIGVHHTNLQGLYTTQIDYDIQSVTSSLSLNSMWFQIGIQIP